jgi:opacity protein-like surface antigen
METTAMKILIAATALAVAIAVPAFAPGQQAQAQTYSKEQAGPQKVKKAKKAKTQNRVVRYGSPYSTNPAHDVYVNGVYVGSDPDPRIRWSLKKEYCEDSVDGC